MLHADSFPLRKNFDQDKQDLLLIKDGASFRSNFPTWWNLNSKLKFVSKHGEIKPLWGQYWEMFWARKERRGARFYLVSLIFFLVLWPHFLGIKGSPFWPSGQIPSESQGIDTLRRVYCFHCFVHRIFTVLCSYPQCSVFISATIFVSVKCVF